MDVSPLCHDLALIKRDVEQCSLLATFMPTCITRCANLVSSWPVFMYNMEDIYPAVSENNEGNKPEAH